MPRVTERKGLEDVLPVMISCKKRYTPQIKGLIIQNLRDVFEKHKPVVETITATFPQGYGIFGTTFSTYIAIPKVRANPNGSLEKGSLATFEKFLTNTVTDQNGQPVHALLHVVRQFEEQQKARKLKKARKYEEDFDSTKYLAAILITANASVNSLLNIVKQDGAINRLLDNLDNKPNSINVGSIASVKNKIYFLRLLTSKGLHNFFSANKVEQEKFLDKLSDLSPSSRGFTQKQFQLFLNLENRVNSFLQGKDREDFNNEIDPTQYELEGAGDELEDAGGELEGAGEELEGAGEELDDKKDFLEAIGFDSTSIGNMDIVIEDKQNYDPIVILGEIGDFLYQRRDKVLRVLEKTSLFELISFKGPIIPKELTQRLTELEGYLDSLDKAKESNKKQRTDDETQQNNEVSTTAAVGGANAPNPIPTGTVTQRLSSVNQQQGFSQG